MDWLICDFSAEYGDITTCIVKTVYKCSENVRRKCYSFI